MCVHACVNLNAANHQTEPFHCWCTEEYLEELETIQDIESTVNQYNPKAWALLLQFLIVDDLRRVCVCVWMCVCHCLCVCMCVCHCLCVCVCMHLY